MSKKTIHNIKTTGFKVPKDYFNNLEDISLTEIKLKTQFETTGFKTPNNYFNTIEERVFSTILEKLQVKIVSIARKKQLLYLSSIAAVITILVSVFIVNNNSNWGKIDYETVENYMIEEDFSSYEIASLLTNDDLNELNFTKYHLNETLIETYLLDHLEINDLITENPF